jgi:DNA-directed RNA polymerase alpha subunit
METNDNIVHVHHPELKYRSTYYNGLENDVPEEIEKVVEETDTNVQTTETAKAENLESARKKADELRKQLGMNKLSKPQKYF